MEFKPQTAIRGVFSVAAINLVARVVSYGKHIVITAYIGLSAQLDAFYVAAAILSMAVFVFGDVFDSLGIPRLVKALREDGEEGFRTLAGSIFSFSLVLSALLCLLLFLIAPWTPWIAPGLSPEKKEFVLRNLYYLFPMAFLYLPYHAIGSFLRAKRRFLAFYIGELIIASTSFLILYVWRDAPYIIPISFSTAYLIIFAYIVAIGMREIRLVAVLESEKMRGLFRMLFSLLPLYLTGYLFTLVDRAFASFLPTGGISGLSYGAMISMIPCSILMLENVFVTPLSETTDRGPLMNDILSGVLIVSIPIAFFAAGYSHQIVKAVFERGVFTSASTQITGDALAFLSFAIPAFFLWPLCYRLFQILEKLKAIAAISVAALLLNAALNALFLKMELGVKGLALATSISNSILVGGAILLLRRYRILVFDRKVQGVLAVSLAVSGIALGLVSVLPVSAKSTGGLILLGVFYVFAVCIMFYGVPNESIRYWRETVLGELNPFPSGRNNPEPLAERRRSEKGQPLRQNRPEPVASKVYILIVNWNGWRDTIECLESVFRNHHPDYQVIVCDNGSDDGSPDLIRAWAEGNLDSAVPGDNPLRRLSFPPVSKPVSWAELDRGQAETGGTGEEDGARLILVHTGANLGFAGGNNVGLRYALARDDFDFVWLLNNDTVIEADALTHLVARMKEKPAAGICGSTLPFYHDPGTLWARGGATYNPWIMHARCLGYLEPLDGRYDGRVVERRMDYVAGASMLVSRAFLRDVGLMGEEYFLFFEELDWAARAAGLYSLAYAPGSIVFHKAGASMETIRKSSEGRRDLVKMTMKNAVRFTRKFHPWALPTLRLSMVCRKILHWTGGRTDRRRESERAP